MINNKIKLLGAFVLVIMLFSNCGKNNGLSDEGNQPGSEKAKSDDQQIASGEGAEEEESEEEKEEESVEEKVESEEEILRKEKYNKNLHHFNAMFPAKVKGGKYDEEGHPLAKSDMTYEESAKSGNAAPITKETTDAWVKQSEQEKAQKLRREEERLRKEEEERLRKEEEERLRKEEEERLRKEEEERLRKEEEERLRKEEEERLRKEEEERLRKEELEEKKNAQPLTYKVNISSESKFATNLEMTKTLDEMVEEKTLEIKQKQEAEKKKEEDEQKMLSYFNAFVKNLPSDLKEKYNLFSDDFKMLISGTSGANDGKLINKLHLMKDDFPYIADKFKEFVEKFDSMSNDDVENKISQDKKNMVSLNKRLTKLKIQSKLKIVPKKNKNNHSALLQQAGSSDIGAMVNNISTIMH